MNIAFLSSSLSRSGGGVTEVKRRLAQSLLAYPDIDLQVHGLRDIDTDKDIAGWRPLVPKVHDISGPRAFGYAAPLLPQLKSKNIDLIHLHGLWQYPSLAVLKSGKPYITTIHGMLEPWAVKNSGFKKKVAGMLYENAALKGANCIHAITEKELLDIRGYGLKNPVCIIPNGVDLPEDIAGLKAHSPVWKLKEPGKKVLLYLGRIHPKKGLSNLLLSWKDAYTNSKSLAQNWELVIAGWDQGGHEDELKRMAATLGIETSVHFIGPQFNTNRLLAYAHADAFILPSFSEGLPMVVLEAWAFSLPVLMTKECNIPEGFAAGAAYAIQPNQGSITQGLLELFSGSDKERSVMGAAGLKLVNQKFKWDQVATQMRKVYQWILGQTEKPDSIEFR